MIEKLCLILALLLLTPSFVMAWQCKMVGGFPVAISEAYLDKAVDILNAEDREAMKKLLMRGVVAVSKDGKTIYVEDVKFGNKAKIRFQGGTQSFWTVRDALDCE